MKESNNKRILKNTLVLYVRMLLVMLVSLYTVRVVLNVLGQEDYGIYNVVGGIIIMFSFFSRTLASASQRYFAFELGKGDKIQLNRVFNLTILLYIFATLFAVILAETVGLWFLNNKMTIPLHRMTSAFWVFQCSVISFCVSLFVAPYQALIIAHERMNVYAVVGVLEAILNLSVALLLPVIPSDSLIAYGAFLLFNVIVTNLIYIIYCNKNFKESKIKYFFDKELAKEMISYSGWNLYGAIANIVRGQGINMLINVFFNPVINAARGLSYQVNSALNSFASNFYTAVRPQVTKYFAKGDRDSMLSLIFSSSKYSFFLIAFLAIPLIVFAEPILSIWLIDIPENTVLFLRLVVIVAMIDSLSNPLMTLAQATGKVRLYQSIIGSLIIMVLPISWFLLKKGFNAEVTMYVDITIAIALLFARLIILKKITDFPFGSFCSKVLFRIGLVAIGSLFGVICSWQVIYIGNPCFVMLAISLCIAVLLSVAVILTIGLNSVERKSVLSFLKTKIGKR